MYGIYWMVRLWVSSWLRKNVKIVVVQRGLVRRFSVVAYAVSLVIMHVYVRRLQNYLIYLCHGTKPGPVRPGTSSYT